MLKQLTKASFTLYYTHDIHKDTYTGAGFLVGIKIQKYKTS
jgi:hypothetical protein